MNDSRMAESRELIKMRLVKEHDDGDTNSLFVRFIELMLEMDRRSCEIESNNRSFELLASHLKERGASV